MKIENISTSKKTIEKRVFCFGETVLDIIFRDNMPIAAKPGGSMLNTAVSLGRAGIPVYFISDFGQDHAGDLIHDFLLENGVSTKYISRYTEGQTAVALAFLDQLQNADYSFYKNFPEERLTAPIPSAQKGDIVLFGSFYALTGSIRPKMMTFLRNAKSNGALVMYDPNFRRAHLGDLETHKPLILDNMRMADIIRGSDEDFMNVFGASDANQSFQHVFGAGCPHLVYTKSSEGVDIITGGYSASYAVPPIQTVSTIGAGDAFNAGMIYYMVNSEFSIGEFSASCWETMIGNGIRFSADVCQSLDNYISIDFGRQVSKATPPPAPSP